MSTDPQLENYLSQLDQALAGIAISDKAEIITELKSHVQEAMNRDPRQNIKEVLQSLGSAEAVAQRYLLERGLKPSKKSSSQGSNFFKWLVIGFLGFFGIFCVTVVFIIWRFMPMISVDETKGNVKLFGGMIDVSGKPGSSSHGVQINSANPSFQGVKVIKGTPVQMTFENGQVNLLTASDDKMMWKCDSDSEAPELTESAGGINFNLPGNVNCEIYMPKNQFLKVKGENGQIDLTKPHFNVDAHLEQGQISISPDESLKYVYDLKINTGHVDQFNSVSSKESLSIKATVETGSINKN